MVATGLTKRYGGVQAVQDVSLTVRAGEILGLVGPNGAGKTTLVDVISGAQTADAGSLVLGGRRVSGPPARRARAGLGRTFQNPQLALDLTARENILVGVAAAHLGGPAGMVRSMLRGVVKGASATDRAEVVSAATKVGLGGIDRRCADLTLGEQRLVEVARVLVQDPEVVLFDEPFAGADGRGVAGISGVINEVRAAGHGAILVDHNVDLVASLADTIMVLNQGSVGFIGTPDECLQSKEMRQIYFVGDALPEGA